MPLRRVLLGGGSGGGGAGFIASVINAGLSFLNRLTLLGGTVMAGVHMSADRQTFQGPPLIPAFATDLLGVSGTGQVVVTPAAVAAASMRAYQGTAQSPALAVAQKAESAWAGTAQTPGISIEELDVVGAPAEPVAVPAFAQAARISDWKVAAGAAGEVVQVVYSLNRRAGGNAQAAVGTAWTTPANAIGIHDAAVATVAGSGLGSTNGIELNYANAVGKGELVITAATLHVYAEVTGDATGLLSDTVISYNIGAGLVQLEAIAGNFASLVTPRSYPLPLLDSWAEYDALAARVVQTMAAASLGVTARLDATEIEIVASRTDAL